MSGEQGRFAKDCTQGGGGGDRSSGCRICKDVGHMAINCPSKHLAEGGGAGHRSGANGHFLKDCSDKKGEGAVGPDWKPTERYTPEGEDAFQERQNTPSGTGINFSAYANIPVKAIGDNVPPPIDSFNKMGLRDLIRTNLAEVGCTEPTPLQQNVYPILASKRDVMVACAETGPGKSLAFLLPIINELMSSQKHSQPLMVPAQPEALILAPTRELAVQIGEDGNLYAKTTTVKIRVFCDGIDPADLYSRIGFGELDCNVLVAMPGIILQLLNDHPVPLALDKVRFFILNDPDHMLDMEDVQKIVKKLPPEVTFGMFSATPTQEIQDSAMIFLKNYISIVEAEVPFTGME